MTSDTILKIGIDGEGRLFIKPDKERFDLIYRTATEVHWDKSGLFLYSPKPREWTYLEWFIHITNVTETECNCKSETRKDTIFSEITLDSTKLASAYRFIQHTKVLDIPSDNMINGWNQGLDGITYIVEHAGKDVYWYKNYWTPSAQGNLREGVNSRSICEWIFGYVGII